MLDPRPRRSRLKRIWRCTWHTTTGVLAAILLTLAAFSFDEELLDTSALRHEPRHIPDTENAYLVLAAAAEHLGSITDLDYPRLLAAIGGTTWNEAEVDAWLQDRDAVLNALGTLRSFQNSQAPVLRDLETALANQPRLDFVGALAALKIRRLHLRGERDAAASLALDAIHAARLLGNSRGDMMHHIYAFRTDETAVEAIFHLASDPTLSSTNLERLRKALSSSRLPRDEFAQAFAADFRRCEMMVETYDNQELLPPKLKTPESRRYFLPYRLPFLFKPNQTLNYAIPYYLFSTNTIDLPLAERKAEADASRHTRVDLCTQYDELTNRWGKRLAHDGLISSLDTFLDTRLRQQTRLSLAETLIALHLYHDAHDRWLPATLADLVPAYLPAVPRDYFSGEPIRYSRDLRAIWSVGPKNFDLTDPDQAVHERELILPLCFDGSYIPWPRRDPDDRRFEEETHSPAEDATPTAEPVSASHTSPDASAASAVSHRAP